MQKFIIKGQKVLHGKIQVSGSKNAVLPILCASLLTKGTSTIHNVPDIADIHTLLKILEELNVKTTFKNHTVEIDPSKIQLNKINEDLICSMRASILLLGPLLSIFKEAHLPFPGGCVLGKRSVYSHTFAFQKLGCEIVDDKKSLHLRAKSFQNTQIIMPEQSVTATENAIMLAVLIPGKTEIKLAALEPHVQDLCNFLNKMGARISGIGTSDLVIEGVKELKPASHDIIGDYLETGTFSIAALLTKGEMEVRGINPNDLNSLWQKFDEIGANYKLGNDYIKILPSQKLNSVEILKTAVYPGFATDLQAPFAVLLTQASGTSKVFETLFEGRLNYLFELERMGAKVNILNPHQAEITGPTILQGMPIASCDIRAGAAMVLAALCAKGETEISNINYIDRGYENLDLKLRSLGADIKRA